jgi:hypothetical protein
LVLGKPYWQPVALVDFLLRAALPPLHAKSEKFKQKRPLSQTVKFRLNSTYRAWLTI